MFSLAGDATLSSINLSRVGGEDSDYTLVTLKLSVETRSDAAICAALGVESGDMLLWAWETPETGDIDACERRYPYMGAIASGLRMEAKHLAQIGGYRDLRPSRVTVESVAPVAKRIWTVALKVQIEHPPAGAVECWAQFIGQSLRIDLQQDPDLFERAQ